MNKSDFELIYIAIFAILIAVVSKHLPMGFALILPIVIYAKRLYIHFLIRNDYIIYWVRFLISSKTIKLHSFEKWINQYNCVSRYKPELLVRMEKEWNRRK